MEQRQLGRSGIKVSAIGLGLMSMSGIYGNANDEESVANIRYAIDKGITFLDSADMYGWGHNETLLGKALKDGWRGKAIVATKFGQVKGADGKQGVDGRPEYVMQACEASLKRLGIDVIDLYYQHRVDPNTPIEDTVGAMKRLIEQGKVRALGISLVPYAPLGRSMLTGTVQGKADLPEGDRRLAHPRFQGDALDKNVALVKRLEAIAREKHCTTPQLALAWLLGQGKDIVPIPGTKRRERIDENLKALEVKLSADELKRISEAAPPGAGAGTRYPADGMKRVYL